MSDRPPEQKEVNPLDGMPSTHFDYAMQTNWLAMRKLDVVIERFDFMQQSGEAYPPTILAAAEEDPTLKEMLAEYLAYREKAFDYFFRVLSTSVAYAVNELKLAEANALLAPIKPKATNGKSRKTKQVPN